MSNIILFDLDGTLTDPKVGITRSVQFALSAFGIQVEEAGSLTHFIGPPLRASFATCYGMSAEQAEEAVAKYREYFEVRGLFENTVYDGIPAMLQALREKEDTLLVASSKPTQYVRQILEHFDLAHHFAFIAGSEMDGRRSDKAEVIRYALASCGLTDTANAIMIGDREHDIHGAKAVGLHSIGVLYGYGARDELTRAGADELADSVAALHMLLTA